MGGPETVSVIIVSLMAGGAVASYGFAWYSWRRADHPISDRFALLMTADGCWALFSLLGHVSPTDSIALLWRTPVTLSAVFAVVFWFMFVVEYTADSEWIPDLVEPLLIVQATLYSVLFVINPGGIAYPTRGVDTFGLIRVPYEEFGPLILGYALVTYVILFFTFGLLGRFVLRARNLYRKQAAVIFTVTFAVLVSTMAYVSGVTPHEQLDLTPVLFATQAVGVGIALYRYDFLDVEPMAAHTVLEEMTDPVFVVDSDERVVDWNEAAADYVGTDGQATLEDLQGLDLASVFTASDGGQRPSTVEGRTITAESDGARRIFDARSTTIDDRYGIVRGHAIVLRDVTEQEQRKRALETQNKRLEEFTGVVSHDLRNPLQVIDGHLKLAEETGDLDHLDGASDAVDRMEHMIEDLLRLAREGRTIDETEAVDLRECCLAAWAAVEDADATLAVETDRTIQADPDRLQRLFENLFRNAVEHGGQGVSVTVGSVDDGFYVADDGPGIPPEEREEVFEFGVTSDEDGSGFGLAIVERIVEAHGWRLDLQESEDGGARFDVRLYGPEPPALDDPPQ